MIDCDGVSFNELPKVFESISKSLANETEKHFENVWISTLSNNTILLDNTFADITFDNLKGNYIKKITDKSFGKSAKTIKKIDCMSSFSGQPKSELWSILSQMNELQEIRFTYIDVTEIPTGFLKPNNGIESKLQSIHLVLLSGWKPDSSVTIKSGAFSHLNNLNNIVINGAQIKSIEKEAFKFDKKSDQKLVIKFSNSYLSADSIEAGSFDRIQRNIVDIVFDSHNIEYVPESSFKLILDNPNNRLYLDTELHYSSSLNCSDHWIAEIIG